MPFCCQQLQRIGDIPILPLLLAGEEPWSMSKSGLKLEWAQTAQDNMDQVVCRCWQVPQ